MQPPQDQGRCLHSSKQRHQVFRFTEGAGLLEQRTQTRVATRFIAQAQVLLVDCSVVVQLVALDQRAHLVLTRPAIGEEVIAHQHRSMLAR
ncbi:hypothetical protein D9M71_698960 [compost metagenome]